MIEQPTRGFACHGDVKDRPDVVEVIATLGDTVIDVALVSGTYRIGTVPGVDLPIAGVTDHVLVRGYVVHPTRGRDRALGPNESVRVELGRVSIRATRISRPAERLPTSHIDRRSCVYISCSLVLHLAVWQVAMRSASTVERAQLPRTKGVQRSHLVAVHASAPRAQRDKRDAPTVRDAEPQPPIRSVAPTPQHRQRPVPELRGGARRAVEPSRRPRIGQHGGDRSRHTDPCSAGECGLIAAGPVSTQRTGRAAGDDFELKPRDPRTLALSVVACDPDGGCSTVSGEDQSDVRAHIQQHVGAIYECFARDPAIDRAAIDFTIAPDGTIAQGPPPADAVARCIVDVTSKISFPRTTDREPRQISLAFVRDQ